jgi:hypothetical protein
MFVFLSHVTVAQIFAQGGKLIGIPADISYYSEAGVIALPQEQWLIGYTMGTDLMLVKLDANGNQMWSHAYYFQGTGIFFRPSLIHLGNGKLAVGANLENMDGLTHFALMVLDSTGSILWQREISHTTAWYGRSDISMDANGNVLVNLSATNAVVVLKFDPTGSLLWSKSFMGDFGNASGKNPCFRVAASGNDVIAVSKDESFPQLLRLDSNGNVVWSKTMVTNDYRHTYGLISDPNGAIWSCGYANGTTAANIIAAFVTKYSANGTLVWSKLFINASGTYFEFHDLVSDNLGGAWVTGTFDGTPLVVHLDANGMIIDDFKVANQLIYADYTEISMSDVGDLMIALGGDYDFNYLAKLQVPGTYCEFTNVSIISLNDSYMMNASVNGTLLQTPDMPTIGTSGITQAAAAHSQIEVCNTLQLQNHQATSVLVFPNPTEQFLFIEGAPGQFVNAELYELSGRKVLDIPSSQLTGNSIDLLGYSGTMLLRLNGADGSICTQIIQVH